jgi:hypothetical protein
MTAPPWCPVCFGELERVRQVGAEGVAFWRCPYCGAPQQPAGADEAPAQGEEAA